MSRPGKEKKNGIKNILRGSHAVSSTAVKLHEKKKKTAKDLQKRDVNATHSHPRFLAQPLLHILAQLQGQLT